MCFYMHLVPRKIPQLCSEIESPNITGALPGIASWADQSGVQGAFEKIDTKVGGLSGGTGTCRNHTVYFYANISSSIYSEVETVQPAALQNLIIIKV